MPGPGVHRELLLPNPRMRDPPRPPRRVPFPSTGGDAAWLEVDWSTGRGSFRYRLGSESASSLALVFAAFAESHAGARLGEQMPCALTGEREPPDLLLRARAVARSHLWPLRLLPEADQAGLLLQSVGSLRGECRALALQLLFRSTGAWERGFLSPRVEHVALDADAHARRAIEDRAGEEPFHVELRVGAWTRQPESVVRALDPWLRSWRLQRGGSWRAWKAIRPRRRDAFLDAMRAHDLRRFAARKARRDISATELAALFPVPWKERHAGLRYAGAPVGGVPVELRAEGAAGGGPVVGRCGSDSVRLPRNWRHLLVLGRTRTGKSSLARSVALQLLRDEPSATVVVLEPTGSLIEGLRARLPLDVARDTIELDPARNSFHDGEEEIVAVPLNLIDHPRGGGGGASDPHDAERRSEKLGGDLLQAIKNAWGEEAVGGRAEFILRGIVQGLSTVEGTNLVDAYSALTDKATLRRLERLAVGGSLKSALRVHLPRLDYAITISSLDKVGKVATNPLLRKTLCQRFAPVPFDRLLRHRLLLLNLAKGALGTEGAGFLGAVLLTKLWSAIQERQPGDPPVYLVVDEFHNYAVPAFADMLSEGARLGLHVVAVTQYLSRIPERVRSALVGNVDAWAIFGLGAEDQRDAWRIVQGSEFGWRPEDLVSGLGPFEAAFYAERTLLKVATSAPEPPSREAAAVAEAVAESSRRYAQPEDSQVSPLAVPKEQLSALIGAICEDGSATLEDLEVQLGWGVTSVRAAVALGASTGDIVRGIDGRVRRTPKAGYFRDAVETSRKEGEEHSALLAEVAGWLSERGLPVRIVPQDGGTRRPDGAFAWRGLEYNLEVECSTLDRRTDQVARNVRKAQADGRRCLLVVSERERAERMAELLATRIPDVDLWGEVGILWRAASGMFRAYESIDRKPWPWIEGGGMAFERDPRPIEDDTEEEEAAAAEILPDPDRERTRTIVAEAVRLGRSEASALELLALEGANLSDPLDERRLGRAMASLGVPNRRTRMGARQVRLYDLRADACRRAGDLGSGTPTSEPSSAHPDGAPTAQSRGSGSRSLDEGPEEEEPQPDEDQEDPDELDREEPFPAVPGEAGVAEGVREARVVDREPLGADGGQSESREGEDGR